MIVPIRTWPIGASLVGFCFIATSCASSVPSNVASCSSAVTSSLAFTPPPRDPQLRIVFRQGKAYAQEGDREWLISEVDQQEMLWAPDGLHFAYLKKVVSPEPSLSAEDPPPDLASPPNISQHKPSPLKKSASSKKLTQVSTPPPDSYHLVIRNIRGDSINEFPIYRPGRPQELDWLDNQRLAYLAPQDPSGDAYVVHSSLTGEILHIWRGSRFIWSPGRRLLAYIQRAKNEELVMISRSAIWPRAPQEKLLPKKVHALNQKSSRKVVGDLVWSPDGNGLAFMESVGRETQLVVLLVYDNPEGDLVWPLPKNAMNPENRVFWADSKVVIGKSVLKPSFAASWTRLH
jgi:hypothetical protein